MYNFTYHRPQDLEMAAALLASSDSKILAGGQTLLPTMKQRLAAPAHLIDVKCLPQLRGIKLQADALIIGATTIHAEVAQSSLVQKSLPALADLASYIGDPHVRHRGTIGGSLANNDPAADYPAAALALEAQIHTNHRIITASDYFLGLFETALQPDEIITSIAFPIGVKAAYVKFPNPASLYAMVGVFIAQLPTEIRVAVTGAGANGVFRAQALESALTKEFSNKALDDIPLATEDLMSDLHGDAHYRAHLIGVMTKRALARMR